MRVSVFDPVISVAEISARVLARAPPHLHPEHLPATPSHGMHRPLRTTDVNGGAFGADRPPSINILDDPSRGLVDGQRRSIVECDANPGYFGCWGGGRAS